MLCIDADRWARLPRRPRTLAGIVLSLIALSSSIVDARSLELTWDAPSTCPSRTDVLVLIETIAGSTASNARARVVVRQDEEGAWQADITMLDARGEAKRTLRGESCRAVAEATGVVLGLAMQQAPLPPPPAPPPKPVQPPTPTKASGDRDFGVAIAGLIDVGTLPSIGVGLTASGSFTTQGLRFELDGHWLAPREAVLDDDPSQGAELSLLRAGLKGCRVFEPNASFAVGPCIAAGYERVTGDGFGSDSPIRSTSESLSFAAGGVGLLHFSETSALRLGLDLSFPLERPTFEIVGTGSVHRAKLAALRISLGPELHF